MYFSSHHLASSIILMVVNLCTTQLIWGYCGMLEKNKQPYRVQIPSTALALRRKGRYLRQGHHARKTGTYVAELPCVAGGPTSTPWGIALSIEDL